MGSDSLIGLLPCENCEDAYDLEIEPNVHVQISVTPQLQGIHFLYNNDLGTFITCRPLDQLLEFVTDRNFGSYTYYVASSRTEATGPYTATFEATSGGPVLRAATQTADNRVPPSYSC